MRDFKFRVWSIERKKWITHACLIAASGEINMLMLDEWKGFHCFKESRENSIKNFVIQLYTGLKDINNKEIYEGDLISCHDDKSKVSEVFFGLYYTIEGYRAHGYHVTFDNDWGLAQYSESSEVVGNVFENPELIK